MTNILNSVKRSDAVIVTVMILQILFFIMCTTAILGQASVHARDCVKEQKTERYRSIRICPGETLWEISRQYYSQEYKSVHLYMKRIMKLNNMSDEGINSGAYLLIPYYD